MVPFSHASLLLTLIAVVSAGDELYDYRGPCGPCFVDASAVSVFYWVTETITFKGYAPVITPITFADTTFNQTEIYYTTACNDTSIKLNIASVTSSSLDDLNFQRGAFTTVVGDELFYVVSTSVGRTISNTVTVYPTGTILSSPTAYFAFTSIDVYPEAEGSRGVDGKVTCQPRTSFSVLIEPTIFVSGASKNYGGVTSYGPDPLPTSLVQLLQANPSLLRRYPELSRCGAGIIQGAPYAVVPITAQTSMNTISCSNAINSTGPIQTKAAGDLLVPGNPGPYVPPTPRQFAGPNALPTRIPVPANPPVQTSNPQPAVAPIPANPPVQTSNPQPAVAPIPANPPVPISNPQPAVAPIPAAVVASTPANNAQPVTQPAPGAVIAAQETTVVRGGIQVTIPADAPSAGVGSAVTLKLPSEIVTGVVVSAKGSVVVLSVPTASGTNGASPTAVQFAGTGSKKNGVHIGMVAGLALLIVMFGSL